MKESTRDQFKKWGMLIIVFLVIVCISGALPRYLTPPAQQPQTAATKQSKTVVPVTAKTGQLALVNEDQGETVNGQNLNLGNQIAPLFSDNDDYKWENVSRSAADAGLKNGDYQAAFYIPSSFTADVFTFNQSKPKTAVITYQTNPKLTAVDAAKVQAEFQKVKGTLNEQFSKIYWRIVSDKINYVNANFSDVLTKDKQYLQAMADFYKPSSQNMAQVFGAQLDQINDLLSETEGTEKNLSDRQATLTDTKTQVSQQLDALNKLSDQMNQQIQTLEKTRDTNKQLVDEAITQSQEDLTKLVATFNNGMVDPLSTSVTIDHPLNTESELTDLNSLINEANDRVAEINKNANEQLGSISSAYQETPADSGDTDDLTSQLTASRDGIITIVDPDQASDLSNIFGQVNTLNSAAQGLYGQGKTLSGQVSSLYDQGHTLFSQGQSLGDQANTLYGQANTLYNQGQDLSDEVQQIYNQANTLYTQGGNLYSQEQTLYQQEQNLYTTAYNNAVNQIQNDINNLSAAKPTTATGAQWDGETDVLNNIESIQDAIGEQSDGLANNDKIIRIDELNSYLNKINNSTNYTSPSVFIDPEDTTNYDETALKTYQLLLETTKDNLDDLLTFVTAYPSQPTSPTDPGLQEPTAPEDIELSEPTPLSVPDFADPETPDPVNLADPNDPTNAIQAALSSVKDWIDISNAQLTKSVTSLGTIQNTAQTVNQTDTLTNTQNSIQDQYNSVIKQYNDALTNQKSELGKVENTLTSDMGDAQQQVTAIAKPLVVNTPDPTFDDVDNGFALSFKSNTFDQLNTIDDSLQNISDNESLILKDSQDVRSLVNGVQGDANQLSGSWGQNVNATAQLGQAVAQTLGNTGVPGNRNQNVYQQLAGPVGLTGLGGLVNTTPNQNQNSAASAAEPAPVQQPFLTLLAVLIAGILTGYFSYYYRRLGRTVNGLISVLLACVSSALIIYYGVQQYNLEGFAGLMWSVFTIALVIGLAAWIHEAFRISEVVGVLVLVAMVVFFTLPLLKTSLDRFAYQNPAADIYLAIANNSGYLIFIKGLIGLFLFMLPVLLVIAVRETIRYFREEKEDEQESL